MENLKRILTHLSAIAALTLTSCVSTPNKDRNDKVDLGDASAPTLSVINARIGDENETIRQHAETTGTASKAVQSTLEAVQGSVGESQKPAVAEAIQNTNQIANKSEQIISATSRIEKDVELLNMINGQIKELERKAADIKRIEAEARQKALEKLHGYIVAFWVIGFVVIVGGAVVSFWVNRTMGFMLMMVGAMMIGFASASQYYMEQIAQFGAFLLVGMILLGMFLLVRSLINAQRTSTAVTEIVQMIEVLKETMTDDEKARIFGPEGIASKTQSWITQEVVARIRAADEKKNQS